MKKTLLTIAIVLGICLTSLAQRPGGGLFQYGAISDEEYYGAGYYELDRLNAPLLPYHDQTDNQNAPLGGGTLLLVGLGTAYLGLRKTVKSQKTDC